MYWWTLAAFKGSCTICASLPARRFRKSSCIDCNRVLGLARYMLCLHAMSLRHASEQSAKIDKPFVAADRHNLTASTAHNIMFGWHANCRLSHQKAFGSCFDWLATLMIKSKCSTAFKLQTCPSEIALPIVWPTCQAANSIQKFDSMQAAHILIRCSFPYALAGFPSC